MKPRIENVNWHFRLPEKKTGPRAVHATDYSACFWWNYIQKKWLPEFNTFRRQAG